MATKEFRETVDNAVNEYVVNPVKNTVKKVVDYVHGSEAQNAKSAAENEAAAKKYPEGPEARYKKMVGKKAGGVIRSSASKRADGIAVKGKTRGKIC